MFLKEHLNKNYNINNTKTNLLLIDLRFLNIL